MRFPIRKTNRLTNYDYKEPRAYFVTICAHNHRKLFGEIVGGDMFRPPFMRLSSVGDIVYDEMETIESHYKNIKIDKYTIMPNHIHMIIRITARMNPCPTAYDISNIVGKFKAAVTRRARKNGLFSIDEKIWQTSFYDHIIRNQTDYDLIWTYIDNNPAKWKEDRFCLP
ncbi:MAG: hypothetical protein E7553_05590 [Ruminococcaceae bacterium]|nr:hypothetical protein [Oscillospiraceae bacterium]